MFIKIKRTSLNNINNNKKNNIRSFNSFIIFTDASILTFLNCLLS